MKSIIGITVILVMIFSSCTPNQEANQWEKCKNETDKGFIKLETEYIESLKKESITETIKEYYLVPLKDNEVDILNDPIDTNKFDYLISTPDGLKNINADLSNIRLIYSDKESISTTLIVNGEVVYAFEKE